MSRRAIAAALASAALALLLAAAAPRAEAVSFVDKQVQAGGLLIQNYINTYGIKHSFVYPDKTMVKKGGGLEDATRIWPSNPWTGKLMAQGTARGTFTYTLGVDRISYRLVMHLSSGNYAFKGAMPSWLKSERDTGSLQNALLLRRYLEAYQAANRDFPASLTPTTLAGYSWPKNPWTGMDMVAGNALGDFAYTRLSSSGYTLKVRLSSRQWSSPLKASVLALTTAPAG